MVLWIAKTKHLFLFEYVMHMLFEHELFVAQAPHQLLIEYVTHTFYLNIAFV